MSYMIGCRFIIALANLSREIYIKLVYEFSLVIYEPLLFLSKYPNLILMNQGHGLDRKRFNRSLRVDFSIIDPLKSH